mmetsp:Transcript_54943/g.102985  ORF Transcript_54943/g.102985 Transcript_54943/m.102985 type:complete len:400 (+) Transcript_54943:496-1695(+)
MSLATTSLRALQRLSVSSSRSCCSTRARSAFKFAKALTDAASTFPNSSSKRASGQPPPSSSSLPLSSLAFSCALTAAQSSWRRGSSSPRLPAEWPFLIASCPALASSEVMRATSALAASSASSACFSCLSRSSSSLRALKCCSTSWALSVNDCTAFSTSAPLPLPPPPSSPNPASAAQVRRPFTSWPNSASSFVFTTSMGSGRHANKSPLAASSRSRELLMAKGHTAVRWNWSRTRPFSSSALARRLANAASTTAASCVMFSHTSVLNSTSTPSTRRPSKLSKSRTASPTASEVTLSLSPASHASPPCFHASHAFELARENRPGAKSHERRSASEHAFTACCSAWAWAAASSARSMDSNAEHGSTRPSRFKASATMGISWDSLGPVKGCPAHCLGPSAS